MLSRRGLLLFAQIVLLNQVGDVGVGVLNDLLNPQVGILWLHPLIDDQPIEFVEDQTSLDLGLPRLPDNSSGLRTDALDNIDQD